MVYYNNYEIIKFILNNEYFLDNLFENSIYNIKDSISLIYEYLTILKMFTSVKIILKIYNFYDFNILILISRI
jgi:hypothetical protein